MVLAPVKVAVAMVPVPLLKLLRVQVWPAVPTVVFARTEEIVAIPEQVAVPFESVAEVGAADAPAPPAVMDSEVPLEIAPAPVNVTVAIASMEPLLNPLRVQVCPAYPEIVPPDV